MTEKRFEMGYDDGLLRFVKDNVTNINLDIVDCWTALNELNDENEELKTKNFAYLQDIEVFKEEITHLKLENEQLQERNDRQAKRLDNLYRLVEEKDWRTLTDILDDFKRCEEQLQREWRTYE